MSLLEIVEVSKSFAPGVRAVDGVSLTLEQGGILCLLGPSGCGKTTLLRIVAGLEFPDSGQVLFDGRDMAGVPPHERGFGMMFQDFALFPHKNVFDNVAFGLRMRHVPTSEIASRVTEMLALVDLSGFEKREIGQLSGGEQQRVALARALAPGPRLLMLDEPLGALDRALRERLMLDVRKILKHVGMTAIYVTHDQTEAFAVSDRLAVMNAGRIEQLDTPQTVYDRPATPFVARFLGLENLLSGRVIALGEVETAVGRFRASGAVPPPGSAVTLLIRPLIRAIETPDGERGSNQIEGEIDTVAFRGRFSQVWVTASGQRLLFELQGAPGFTAGNRVRIDLQPEQLQLFHTNQE